MIKHLFDNLDSPNKYSEEILSTKHITQNLERILAILQNLGDDTVRKILSEGCSKIYELPKVQCYSHIEKLFYWKNQKTFDDDNIYRSKNLRNLLENEWTKRRKPKCIAITKYENRESFFALNKFDKDLTSTSTICNTIVKILMKELNAQSVTRVAVQQKRNTNNQQIPYVNPIYLTRGTMHELKYSTYLEYCKTHKEENNNRLFSCAERKLYSFLGNLSNRVYVSVASCEMCKRVNYVRYPSILTIPILPYSPGLSEEREIKYDKVAEDIITQQNP